MSPAATSAFSWEVSCPRPTRRAPALLQSSRKGEGCEENKHPGQLQSSRNRSPCQRSAPPGCGEGSTILCLCGGAKRRASPTAACFNRSPC